MTVTLSQTPWKGPVLLVVFGMLLSVMGCVTKETYTQQVNRTTNLQRLLAEEEKRSSDLTADVARLKRQVGDLEGQNKTISDQLRDARAQVVRSLEEVGKLQEEIQTRRASSKGKKAAPPASMEPPDRLDELQFDTPSTGKKQTKASRSTSADQTGAVYHEVKRGDTLFNIAKRHNTDVKTLKELNGLTDNTIEIGERLVIRKE
jgi:LysM repeat protein